MKRYKKKFLNEKIISGIESIISSLNSLVDSKLINDYVIGGATALMYYSDPVATEDIDVFISVSSKEIIYDLSPIYSFLKKEGFIYDGEHLVLNGVPLQILIPGDSLTKEAHDSPVIIKIGGYDVPIFSLEYLIALMVKLYKSKYTSRLISVLEENKFDNTKLNDILLRHQLSEKFEIIKRKFEL